MKATAYIRVSNTEQVDGHSLEAQERAIGEYCRTRGWELVTVYREEGKSAHTDSIHKRPIFRQLLDDCSNRDSPDQTNFPGYSSRGDTAKYNPAFQERQMRSDAA